jgi:hypothetical protein
VAAAAAVAFHPARSDVVGLDTFFPFVSLEQKAWLIGALALARCAAALTYLVLNLHAQHRRLLQRLDVLERKVFENSNYQRPGDAPIQLGLPLDDVAPKFTLNNLNGQEVSLQGLLSQGKSVVAIFMDPDCDPCTAMLPNIEFWQKTLPPRTELVVISRGTIAQNIAKFGNRAIRNVLIQRDREVANEFQCRGTPGAVWISPDGRVASSLAMGPPAIITLITAVQADSNLVPMSDVQWGPL